MKRNIFYLMGLLALLGFDTPNAKELTTDEFEERLMRSKQFFTTEEYSFVLNYKSFLGHEATFVNDELNALTIRKGKEFFSDGMGYKVVQNEKIRLVISEASREIVMVDPDFKFDNQLLINDYAQKMNEIERITEVPSNSGFMVILQMKPKLELERQELVFDDAGMIRSMTTFYGQEVVEQNDNGQTRKGKPKLQVEFKDIRKSVAFTADQKVEHYVTRTAKGYELTGVYSSYHLVDYRIDK